MMNSKVLAFVLPILSTGLHVRIPEAPNSTTSELKVQNVSESVEDSHLLTKGLKESEVSEEVQKQIDMARMTEHSMSSTEAWCILRVCLIPTWFSWFPVCVPFCPMWHKHKSGTQWHVLRFAAYNKNSHNACTNPQKLIDENKVWLPLGTNMIVAGKCYVMTQRLAHFQHGDPSWNLSPHDSMCKSNASFRGSFARWTDPCWKWAGSVKLGACKSISGGGPKKVAGSWDFWNNAHCAGTARKCFGAGGVTNPKGPACNGWGQDNGYVAGGSTSTLTLPFDTYKSCAVFSLNANFYMLQQFNTPNLANCPR